MTVGIIGVGMVGSAMLQLFTEKGVQVITYDKFRPGFTDDDVHFEALDQTDIVFISVPTLTTEGGCQDLTPLEDTFKRLEQIRYSGIVVNKCTVLPGTSRQLARRYSSLKIVHYPEFLTAAKAYEDFKNQPAALLSGQPHYAITVGEFLRSIIPNLEIRFFSEFASTEVAKYMHNCFLAIKTSFCNEMFDICSIYKVSYQEMVSGVLTQGKMTANHTRVPGPDGKRGWGGFCFPKDTKAFLHLMKAQGVPMDTLSGAIDSNSKVRAS